MPLPQIAVCPLCSFESHVGKCPRLPKGKWWCGPCLLNTIPAPRPGDNKISNAVLIAAGIKRTAKWCKVCGAPICDTHANPARGSKRCSPDCRLRTPAELQVLRALLEVYVPDFLTAIPRCEVCSDPVYRKKMCQRHHAHVKAGKRVLPVERIYRFHAKPLRGAYIYLDEGLYAHARDLASRAGVSFNRWAADIISRAAKFTVVPRFYDVRDASPPAGPGG